MSSLHICCDVIRDIIQDITRVLRKPWSLSDLVGVNLKVTFTRLLLLTYDWLSLRVDMLSSLRILHSSPCTWSGTYYSLIARLDVSDVDNIIELMPLDTYSTIIINHCDCVWAFVLRTTILVLVVFFSIILLPIWYVCGILFAFSRSLLLCMIFCLRWWM